MRRRVVGFFVAAVVSCLVSSLFSCPAMAYDPKKMEADFNDLVKLGNSIQDQTVKTSQVMSRALSSKGKPVFEFTAGQLEKIHGQLTHTSGGNDRPDTPGSAIKPPVQGTGDKPASHGALIDKIIQEKLISVSGQGNTLQGKPLAGTQTQAGVVVDLKRGDRASRRPGGPMKPGKPGSLVQDPAVKPAGNGSATGSETLAQYTERVENEAVQKVIDGRAGLEGDSERFRSGCAEFAAKLMSPAAGQARARFHQLLTEGRNRHIRWYFAGVAAMVAGHPDLENDPAVKKLDALMVDLQGESKMNAKKIDWDFTVAVAKEGAAKKSLNQFVAKRSERIKRADARMAAEGSGAGPARASRAGGKPRGKLKTSYWSNAWNHVWGDMGDHMQSNLDMGKEYGKFAGEVVSLASGIKGAYGAMASNPVASNIAHQVGRYAQDTAIGEMGMGPPDPYSIVGHYAGGALGVFGGSIATAAGWVCGTIEAEMAQRGWRSGGKPGRAASRSGTADAAMGMADQKIKLFGN